jgi:exodeoxyribonuclease V alpha subunit
MSIDLNALSNHEFFTELDRRFASFIAGLSPDESPELMLASLLVSTMTVRGNICVEIPAIAGRHLLDVIGEGDGLSPSTNDLLLPKLQQWIDALRKSALVGNPGEYKPLILDGKGRLYLYRYWEYEQHLAEGIIERLSRAPGAIDFPLLGEGLNRLFPHGGEGIDWQRVAALTAVIRNFCVISGGPGTGKTSTVIKILALLLEQAQAGGHTLQIALAAPTGKAAARLTESVREMRESLECSDAIREGIPSESFTIHRLLGSIHGSPYFRHNADNPLSYDVVVVDESSMADLALMSKLLQAVSQSARLILLGDKDQLSSVEAGAVLGDICDTGNEHGYSEGFRTAIEDIGNEIIPVEGGRAEGSPIADAIVFLRRSYRFGSRSGIGLVSNSIRIGDAEKAIELLKEGGFEDITVNAMSGHNILGSLAQHIVSGYSPYLMAESPDEAFHNFSRFTILCALRRGPFGVQYINYVAEKILAREGLINREGQWYRGRPIMITQNNYDLKLFNGDIGLILQDDSGDMPAAFFPSADGTIKRVLSLKLPDHDTAFSMTVHKSQGSEFDNVLLLLPDRPSRVLTRELVYTAITRARRKVEIWGDEDVLRFAINNPTRRRSGLRDILWE